MADRIDYDDDRKVFRVEDGERHYYVAERAWEALKAHVELMDAEEYTLFTVAEEQPDKVLEVGFDDPSDMRKFPTHWERVEHQEPRKWRCAIRATCAEWALHSDRGEQVSSTCF